MLSGGARECPWSKWGHRSPDKVSIRRVAVPPVGKSPTSGKSPTGHHEVDRNHDAVRAQLVDLELTRTLAPDPNPNPNPKPNPNPSPNPNLNMNSSVGSSSDSSSSSSSVVGGAVVMAHVGAREKKGAKCSKRSSNQGP